MATDGAKPRVFLRGMDSREYGLKDFRRAQLEAPRVRGAASDTEIGPGALGYSEGSAAAWRLAPGDEPFLTQTLQVHFVEIPARGANQGHGHQNEAAFYILEGSGYEIHDDQRYDWSKDDLVFVHTDSVHQHFNDTDDTALALVFKAKSAWMYLGLVQQGTAGPLADEERYGPRQDWSAVWTPGVEGLSKVVKAAETRWEDTPDGRVRILSSPDRDDLRCFSVDVYQQQIPPGGRSSRHWHMADEVLYVMAGSGTSRQWQVEAEIAERYYARIATEPQVDRFRAGDTVYVPQNTVHQFVADEGEPLLLLSAQNRLFRHLGYDRVTVLEPATEAGAQPLAVS